MNDEECAAVRFKTADGQIFEEKGAAQRHEKDCRLKEKLRAFAMVNVCRDMDEDDIVEMLFENRDTLRDLFNGEEIR